MMELGSVLPFGPVGVAALVALVVGLLLAVLGPNTRVSHFYPSGASMWMVPASIDVSADQSMNGGIRLDPNRAYGLAT